MTAAGGGGGCDEEELRDLSLKSWTNLGGGGLGAGGAGGSQPKMIALSLSLLCSHSGTFFEFRVLLLRSSKVRFKRSRWNWLPKPWLKMRRS